MEAVSGLLIAGAVSGATGDAAGDAAHNCGVASHRLRIRRCAPGSLYLWKGPFDGALDQIATGKTIKRIEVNPSSAARGHLKVSSKLLQLAIIAGGAPHGK